MVEKLVHHDTCSLWFDLYHVGNKVDYDEWPDGSWYEMEISNFANASFTIKNKMRFYINDGESFDDMLEFIMEAKPLLKKFVQELKEMRENY